MAFVGSNFSETGEMTGSFRTHDERHKHVCLEPTSDGPAIQLIRALGREHGGLVIATVAICSFVLAAILTLVVGILITRVFEHSALVAWDHHVSQWFDNHRSSRWNKLTGYTTDLADTFPIAGVAAGVTVILLVRRWRSQSFLLVAGLVLETSVILTVNKIVARDRPSVRHLGSTPSTYSFPSGHTAATVVLYGGVAIIVSGATIRWWARVAVWTLAIGVSVAVGLSRVYRGDHYPTDVFTGALLGVGSLFAGVFIIRVMRANRVTLSPASTSPPGVVPSNSEEDAGAWR